MGPWSDWEGTYENEAAEVDNEEERVRDRSVANALHTFVGIKDSLEVARTDIHEHSRALFDPQTDLNE